MMYLVQINGAQWYTDKLPSPDSGVEVVMEIQEAPSAVPPAPTIVTNFTKRL